MVVRRRDNWDDPRVRIEFEREATERGLVFQRRWTRNPRRLQYTTSIEVPVYDEPRTVVVTLPSLRGRHVYPDVSISGPICRRHRFTERRLCLWWARDGVERKWSLQDGLYALVELTAEHAFCEAECRAGRSWPKPEASRKHRGRRGCPSCDPSWP